MTSPRSERALIPFRTTGLSIADLSEILVIALVSRTVMPMRVPTGQVFSHMLGVFTIDDYGAQPVNEWVQIRV